MRSLCSAKALSIPNLLTAAFLSTSHLTAAFIIPYVYPRIARVASDNPSASGTPTSFQELGHVDTVTGGSSTTLDPEESSIPTTISSVPPLDASEQQDLDEPDTDIFSNLTTSRLSDSALPNNCASSPLWYTPPLLSPTASPPALNDFITDCFLAAQHLYITDVHFSARSNVQTEFVAPPGSSGLPDGMAHTVLKGEFVQETPVLYEANTCTLAVVMLGHFVNVTSDLGGTRLLPGGIAGTGSGGRVPGRGAGRGRGYEKVVSDTSTWRKVHAAGRTVENECLRRWGRAGWIATGDSSGIGVFLWATNSTLDHQFRQSLEYTTQLIGSGNGTSEQSVVAPQSPQPSLKASSSSTSEPKL